MVIMSIVTQNISPYSLNLGNYTPLLSRMFDDSESKEHLTKMKEVK